jgi:hypothetical protein
MGVIKNEKGLLIKNRISSYLKPNFDILYVEQEPPGVIFEYPAIKTTLELAIEKNEPVLYIHTKGAIDPNNMWYQTPVKKLWEQEFGTNKVKNSYKHVCCDKPKIICPIAGNAKQTWFNGFIINPAAAKIILPTLKTPDKLKDNKITKNSRYYHEYFMCNFPEIAIISSAVKGVHDVKNTHKLLKELTKNLPDIDY